MSVIYDEILTFINKNKMKLFEINSNVSLDEYFNCIESNILSDIILLIKNAKNVSLKTCEIENNNTINICCDAVNIINNIIMIGDDYYIVSKFKVYDELKYCKISVYPDLENDIGNVADIKIIGYIGDKLHQIASVMQIRNDIESYKHIIDPIIKPLTYIDGEFKNNKNIGLNKCNKHQADAIKSLKHNIEIIHGPPGTGKTTTIMNIINEKIPDNHVILCTAIQNQAIESIVIKLMNDKSLKGCFVVVGDEGRLKKNSASHTMDKLFENNVILKELTEKIKHDDNVLERIKTKSYKSKYYLMPKEEQKEYIKKKERKVQENETALTIQKAKILMNIKIFVSTIGSSHKLYNSISGDVDTIIIDEAGATTEMQLFPLIRLKPKNIILVGDHKQLEGFTYGSNSSIDVFYNKSLLERMVINNRKHNLLKCQYRMQDNICKLVSELFYDGLLYSDKSRIFESNKNIIWHNVSCMHKNSGTSFYNEGEVNTIVEICNDDNHKNDNILILTFYNSQLELLKSKFEHKKNIMCRSVDSCQGMESNIVIISLVKSNNPSEFVCDPKRICVLLSRVKNKLIIVGNKQIFYKNDIWKKVIDHIDKLT